ncbi:gluconate kinase [Chitinophaga silvatica]|uniref:Gluconate kinase n=1 Tax=Chitinophaga silvatica TaxID=2282649 RepID=A0A3E1YBD8_9BACT|nr:gluconokinase [Chitinophaga silvatica]RFS23338.1 gluconate kinase [Chitinophaga silvatica]
MSVHNSYIIGLDIGTSSTKSIVRLKNGNSETIFQQSYSTKHPLPGYSEQDPAAILMAVKQGIRKTVETLKGPPTAISFSSAMHSFMALDHAGVPLTPLIIWGDNRSTAYAESLKASAEGNMIYKQTGTPVHAMSPLSKLLWLRNEEIEIFNNSFMFVGIKEYILHHFFGEYLIDHSIASATGLFDIHTHRWNELALKISGISATQLPRPVQANHVITGLKASVAEELGIPADTPIIIGGSDGCLAQLGSKAMDKGHATLTIGTSGAMRVAGSDPIVDTEQRLFTYLLTDDVYITGGATNNGGVVLQWMMEELFQQPLEELGDRISSALATAPDKLLCLPYLLGERAPIWDSNATAAFIGIQPQHNAAHFTRATIEGICFVLLSIKKALEETVGEITKISVSGGFTHTPSWMQLLANIFEQEIYYEQTNDASARGAIMLAALELGWKFEEEAEIENVFTPDPTYREVYRLNYQRFKKLYEVLLTVP